MEKKFLILCSILGLIFMASSCSMDKPLDLSDGDAIVRLNLTPDWTLTKADPQGILDVNDFKIEVVNSEGVIFKRWKTYADYLAEEDQAFLIKAGKEYTFRAFYGDSTAVGFDAFYFYGEEKFVAEPQSDNNITIVCRQGNVKVRVLYADNMSEEYLSYHSTVKHSESRDSLQYAQDCEEAGYFPAGGLDLYLYIETFDGEKIRYGTKEPYLTSAGDSITFTINPIISPKDTLLFDISIENSTRDSVVNVTLGDDFMPKDAPVFVLDGFSPETGVATILEGVAPNKMAVNINAAGVIAGCTMKVSSAYLESKGFPTEVDFFNVSPEDQQIMEQCGLDWTNDMSGLTLANIGFRKLANNLAYVNEESRLNTFEISVTDEKGKSVTSTYIIDVEKASISISPISEGNTWSKSTIVNMSTNGDINRLKLQVKADGSDEWITPKYTSSVSEGNVTYNVTGLNPGTQYSVRGVYNLHDTGELAFATEAELQMGNSGFESFYYTSEKKTYKTLFVTTTGYRYMFYPYAMGETDIWWNTNNDITAPANHNEAGYFYLKCFPAVTYTVSDTYNWSSKSAEIRSIATKNGNSLVLTSGKRQGQLYCDKHAFASRPTKLQFHYKYDAYNNDTYKVVVELRNGDNVIASNEYTAGAAASWTLGEIPFNYSSTAEKATSISVYFYSSVNSEPDVRTHESLNLYVEDGVLEFSNAGGTFNTNRNGVNYGSCLTIDNIKLVYDK